MSSEDPETVGIRLRLVNGANTGIVLLWAKSSVVVQGKLTYSFC